MALSPGVVPNYRIAVPHYWAGLIDLSPRDAKALTRISAHKHDDGDAAATTVIGRHTDGHIDRKRALRAKHPDLSDANLEALLHQEDGRRQATLNAERDRLGAVLAARSEAAVARKLHRAEPPEIIRASDGKPRTLDADTRLWMSANHPAELQQWDAVLSAARAAEREAHRARVPDVSEAECRRLEEKNAKQRAELAERQAERSAELKEKTHARAGHLEAVADRRCEQQARQAEQLKAKVDAKASLVRSARDAREGTLRERSAIASQSADRRPTPRQRSLSDEGELKPDRKTHRFPYRAGSGEAAHPRPPAATAELTTTTTRLQNPAVRSNSLQPSPRHATIASHESPRSPQFLGSPGLGGGEHNSLPTTPAAALSPCSTKLEQSRGLPNLIPSSNPHERRAAALARVAQAKEKKKRDAEARLAQYEAHVEEVAASRAEAHAAMSGRYQRRLDAAASRIDTLDDAKTAQMQRQRNEERARCARAEDAHAAAEAVREAQSARRARRAHEARWEAHVRAEERAAARVARIEREMAELDERRKAAQATRSGFGSPDRPSSPLSMWAQNLAAASASFQAFPPPLATVNNNLVPLVPPAAVPAGAAGGPPVPVPPPPVDGGDRASRRSTGDSSAGGAALHYYRGCHRRKHHHTSPTSYPQQRNRSTGTAASVVRRVSAEEAAVEARLADAAELRFEIQERKRAEHAKLAEARREGQQKRAATLAEARAAKAAVVVASSTRETEAEQRHQAASVALQTEETQKRSLVIGDERTGRRTLVDRLAAEHSSLLRDQRRSASGGSGGAGRHSATSPTTTPRVQSPVVVRRSTPVTDALQRRDAALSARRERLIEKIAQDEGAQRRAESARPAHCGHRKQRRVREPESAESVLDRADGAAAAIQARQAAAAMNRARRDAELADGAAKRREALNRSMAQAGACTAEQADRVSDRERQKHAKHESRFRLVPRPPLPR